MNKRRQLQDLLMFYHFLLKYYRTTDQHYLYIRLFLQEVLPVIQEAETLSRLPVKYPLTYVEH